MLGLLTLALQAPSSNQALELLTALESLGPKRPRVGGGAQAQRGQNGRKHSLVCYLCLMESRLSLHERKLTTEPHGTGRAALL